MIYQKIITEDSEEVRTKNLVADYGKITHLSINALPGTAFSITGNSSETFKIDYTGIFDLDCSAMPITKLYLITWIAGPVIIDVVGG